MKRVPKLGLLLLPTLLCLLVVSGPAYAIAYGERVSSVLPPEAGLRQGSGVLPQPRTAGTLEPVPLHFASAEYAPAQIIVKLKPSAKLDDSKLSGAGYLASVPAFKGLAAKHRIRNARQVFRNLDSEKVKKRFVQRAKRARKDAVPPDLSTVYTLVLDDAQAPILDICARLRQEPDVEFAEPNYVARIQMAPNDPYYSSSGSWGQAYDDLWGIKKINCEPAWDVSLGDGVVVAVIDTGLDYNHEDISANVWANSAEDINHNGKFDNWPSTEQQGGVYGDLDGVDNDSNGKIDDVMGWDFCTYGGNVPDNNPMDDMGHGTHVSGTIAAVGNNGIGVIGVAPHAKIMPVKGLNYQGTGYNDDLAACITYAADNGADVLNCSWGSLTHVLSSVIGNAVAHANALGCVVVAAAGNNNMGLGPELYQFDPATLPGVVAVAATDTTDRRASFANYGASVDVAAPGVDVLSLRAADTDLYLGASGYTPGQNFVPAFDPNAKYYRASGTSMACPHVAGLAGLILSAHPAWSSIQVERATENASDVPLSSDTYVGAGRVNAANALQVTSVSSAAVAITNPVENVYIRDLDQIIGTATGVSYVVELGAGNYPSSWTQIGSGGPTTNGVLATFHGAGVADGFYTLRLRSEDATETVRCYYDALLRVGFPKQAVHQYENSIVTTDIDNDGEDEIVATTTIGVDVVNKDGTEVSGYPVYLTSGYGNSWLIVYASPAVGDVCGDSSKEVVVQGWDQIAWSPDRWCAQTQLLNATGQMLWRYNAVDECAYSSPPPMLVDRNLDGKYEIIVWSAGAPNTSKANQLFIYMLSGSGSVIWRTTLNAQMGMISHGAVGDINGDAAEETVLGLQMDSNSDGVYDTSEIAALDINGNVLFRTSATNPGNASGALTLADVSGDGVPEVLFAPWSYPAGGRVYAFNGQGSQLWASQQVEGTIFSISPGDLNADGSPELVVRCYDGANSESNNKIYVLNGAGAILNHWTDNRRGWVTLNNPPVAAIADMDGDRTPDIVGQGYAWNPTGSAVSSFPRLAYADGWSGNAAIAHLTLGSQMDLCGSTNSYRVDAHALISLFAWQLPVAFDRRALEWPMFAHDARNTNCYIDPSLKVAAPTFVPDGGTYTAPQTVAIECVTPRALIHYTADGREPTLDDPLILSGSSVAIQQSCVLNARAWKDEWIPSDVKSAVYTFYFGKLPDPDFSPDGGTYTSAQNVAISCATPDAVIHYTTNGVDPTESDLVVSGPVLVDRSMTLKARAYKADWTPSDVKSAVYTITGTVVTPTFSPVGGTYTSPQNVTVSCATPGATIHYTTNGVDPTESDSVVSGPVLVDASMTLKARAYKTDWTPSDVKSAVYTLTVATPTFAPDGGTYSSPQNVTITCATPGAVIHYTTSGVDPTESDPVVSGPVLVDTSMTLKARAYKTDWLASDIKSAVYLITRLPEIKKQANGTSVSFSRAVVTGAFSGLFYVESDDRTCGIRVQLSGHTLSAGMRADVSGLMNTNSYRERYVEATTAVQSPPPNNIGTVDPLLLINREVGGGNWEYDPVTGAGQIGVKGNSSLNNIGLLITTTGRITYSPVGSYFVTSDGSEVTDLSGYQGVRIMWTGTKPSVGQYVKVTGISSIFRSGTDCYPFIRVRTQADIVVLQ